MDVATLMLADVETNSWELVVRHIKNDVDICPCDDTKSSTNFKSLRTFDVASSDGQPRPV